MNGSISSLHVYYGLRPPQLWLLPPHLKQDAHHTATLPISCAHTPQLLYTAKGHTQKRYGSGRGKQLTLTKQVLSTKQAEHRWCCVSSPGPDIKGAVGGAASLCHCGLALQLERGCASAVIYFPLLISSSHCLPSSLTTAPAPVPLLRQPVLVDSHTPSPVPASCVTNPSLRPRAHRFPLCLPSRVCPCPC